MTWVKLDDGFPRHPKIVGLSDRAFRAHVEALCYAATYTTDGYLTSGVARHLASPAARRELAEAGVWDVNGDGYAIHDYLAYQPSRAEVEAERQRRTREQSQGRARQRRYRERADA